MQFPRRSYLPSRDKMTEPILEIRGLGKSYPGVVALDGVELDLFAGEVHALLGENGAGKSTLLKILSGDQSPGSGSMRLKGEAYAPVSPIAAQERGVVTVHQELSLIPDLSVAENIMLAREPTRRGIVSWSAMRAQAAELCATVGLARSPQESVRNLSVAEQQLVEIARALSVRADVLILDEPTATLTGTEVQRLKQVVEGLKAKGVAIIFVTHRLTEVFQLCDRYTVLRDGRKVAGGDVSSIDIDGLISAMVGRAAVDAFPRRVAPSIGALRLRVRDACYLSESGGKTATPIHNVDLDLHSGEILGLAGLVGAGRTQLARCIFGADRLSRGTVELDGARMDFSGPVEAIAAGLAFVPEDRKGQGLFLDLAVRTNFSIAALSSFANRLGKLALGREQARFDEYHRKFRIKTSDPRRPIKSLSGGNQQKVILARWVALGPKVLIVDEPTRGIDVGAKAEIYQLLYELADQGVAILVISSEMPELMAVSDRIAVMREGRIVGELARDEISESNIGAFMLAGGQQAATEVNHV